MSFDTFNCPHCKGQKESMVFIHRTNECSVEPLRCRTCNGRGRLDAAEMYEYSTKEAKRKERRAYRESLDLSMREMAKKLSITMTEYSLYEHGETD